MDVEMLNKLIKEVTDTEELTPDKCSRLADLYIIRDHFEKDDVEKEIDDILPAYREYIDIKTRYQKSEISDAPVRRAINGVCSEIYELIVTMYRCSDLPQERQLIVDMINRLVNIC